MQVTLKHLGCCSWAQAGRALALFHYNAVCHTMATEEKPLLLASGCVFPDSLMAEWL